MPIINPTCWGYRNLLAGDGRRFSLLICRGAGGTNNAYKYAVDNPSDVIWVDDLAIPHEHWGDTGMEEFDEDGDEVPISFNFGINDQFNFKGKLGDGTVVTEQNLRTENTTFLSHIFNKLFDIDPATGKRYIYYVFKSWIAENNTLQEVYYSGSLDPEKITKNPFYREKSMTDSESSLETWKFQTSTVNEILSKLFIQDLVENLTQDDMATAHRKAWYAGTVLAKHSDYPRTGSVGVYDYHDLGNGKFTGRIYQGYPEGSGADYGYVAAQYSYDTNASKLPFNVHKNVYGVEHGFQGIGYGKIMDKIASLGRFVFDAGSSDKPFAVYSPSYFHPIDATHEGYGLSTIGDTYWDGYICKNYNILFGIRPDDYVLTDRTFTTNDSTVSTDANADFTNGGYLDHWKILSMTNASPAVIEVDAAPTIPLRRGQWVRVSGCHGNTAANGISLWISSVIDATHITVAIIGPDISGGIGSDINGNGAYTGNGVLQRPNDAYYASYQTPGTIARTETLGSLLRAVCDRFGYSMEWDIGQSGANIGKPILILKDILTGTHDAPVVWQDEEKCPRMLQGSETQNTTLAKVAVKLTYKGDETAVYCPRKPRIGEQVIEKEIFTRYKKWGEWDGYSKSNFINDRTKDVTDQRNTFYNIDHESIDEGFLNIDTTPMGYLLGMNDFYLFDDGVTIYGTTYPSHNLMQGESGSNTGGFYAMSYEKYHGGNVTHLSDINQDYFNTIVEKSIIFANYYLLNKTTDVRVIRGIRDDSGSTRKLLRRLKTHWRDTSGTVTYKRASKIYINEFSDRCVVHFVSAKADDSVLDPQFNKYIIDEGTQGSGSSIAGGGPVGGGGGATVDDSNSLIKRPKTDDRDFITLDFDTIGGGIIANSAQTKDQWQYQNSALTILSGVTAGGTFYTKLQDAIEIRPIGSLTGELRFLELAANGVHYTAIKSADNNVSSRVLVLPNTDPSAGQALIVNSFSGGIASLGYSNILTSLTGALIINPVGATRNQALTQDNSSPGLILRDGGFTIDLFRALNSSGTIKVKIDRNGNLTTNGTLDTNGILNVNSGAIFSGINPIGLDSGSAIGFGTLGQVIAKIDSGLGLGHAYWANPIWRDPFVLSANAIAPSGDIICLDISPNILLTGSKSVLFRSVSGTVNSFIDYTGALQIGVFGANYENLAQALAVWGAGGSPAVIFREGGGDILRFMPASPSSTILLKVTSAGDLLSSHIIGTSDKVGGGIQAPTAPGHFFKSTSGVMMRHDGDGIVSDYLHDKVSTNNGGWTDIHVIACSNQTQIDFVAELSGLQTNNVGGSQWKSCKGWIIGGFSVNNAGVITASGNFTPAPFKSSISGVGGAGVVFGGIRVVLRAGPKIVIQVNDGTAAVDWICRIWGVNIN